MMADNFQSETFTPFPSNDQETTNGIGFNPFVHGSNGPMNVSFSNYVYGQTRNVLMALNELGVATSFDPNDGGSAGASFLPVSLDPTKQVRADARTAYDSTIHSRPNLEVWTGQHVTRILFDESSGRSPSPAFKPGDGLKRDKVTNTDSSWSELTNFTAIFDSVVRDSAAMKLVNSIAVWLAHRAMRLARLDARQVIDQKPSESVGNLKAVGVEVDEQHILAHSRSSKAHSSTVLCKLHCDKADSTRDTGSHHICWCPPYASVAQTLWYWSSCGAG